MLGQVGQGLLSNPSQCVSQRCWEQEWKEEAAQRSQTWLCLLPHSPQKEAVPSTLGHQIGILTLLWWDRDKITQQNSHLCVYLLMELVFQQKGEWGRGRGRGSGLGKGAGGEAALLLSTTVHREAGGVRTME